MSNQQTPNPTTLLEFVAGLSDAELASAWAELNGWEWPIGWPDGFKPHWWDRPDLDPMSDRKLGFVSPFSDYAMFRAGEKACSAAWRSRLPKGKFRQKS